MFILYGRIVENDSEKGEIKIVAKYPASVVGAKVKKEVEILLEDGRSLSPEQRRKAYALEGDIARWAGYYGKEDRAFLHVALKELHMVKQGVDEFSLSNCDMTTARQYINTLIDFVLEHEVPCIDLLLNRTDDIGAYLYSCLYHRRCAICGDKADVHHTSAIGMGRNRKKINHVGMLAMALCRKHHQEAHERGQEPFNELYHVYGIKLDENLVKRLNL